MVCLADAFDELTQLLEISGVTPTIDDKRFDGKKIKARFIGKLRPEQKEAAEQLLKHDTGVLAAATGFGKTVLAAYCIAKRKANTLVIVHRQELLEQWKDRLGSFLQVPPESIGQIGAGKRAPTGIIDIAMVRSLRSKGEVADLVADYGHVVVDECHHVGAVDFEQVLRQVKVRWVLGLTATPVRYDGHHPIIIMQCGAIRYRVRQRDHDTGITEHVVLPRITEARLPDFAENFGVQEKISALVSDERRNEMIIDDVLKAVSEKRSPLVLTKRKDHLQLLRDKLEGKVKNVIVFRGGQSAKRRRERAEQLQAVAPGEERVVLGIGECIGEGFDDPRLDTLFLTLPISWHAKLEQYAGRLHRRHQGKTVVQIYDYVDVGIEKLYKMFRTRQAGYKRIGYTVRDILSGSSENGA